MKLNPPRTAPVQLADPAVARVRHTTSAVDAESAAERRPPRTAREDIAIGPEPGGRSADLGETLRRGRI
jgi:hypothetical protein